MELKYLRYDMEIKEINDDGEFFGTASAYGNIDYANEVMVKGAFDKHMDTTMFPMLWQHKTESPIGVIHILGSDGDGLEIKGEINLEVQQGKEAHSLLKQKAIKGLSIGYTVLDDKWDKRIRYLTEVKLWEVSIVTFPCNELAQVSQVKSDISDGEDNSLKSDVGDCVEVKDFNSVLQQRLMWMERWELFEVLEDIVIDLLYSESDDEEVKNVIAESCDQFKVSLLDWVDRALNSDMYKSREENVNWKKEIISDLRDSGILKLPFSKISSNEDIKNKDKLDGIMNEMKSFKSKHDDSDGIIKDMKNFINEREVN